MRIFSNSAQAKSGSSFANLLWLLLIMGLAAIYLPYSAQAKVAGFVADDAIYLLMADYFSGTYRDEAVLHYLRSVSHFPPLYSICLAAVGAISAQLDIAHLLQSIFMLLGFYLWALLAGRLSGQPAVGYCTLLALPVMPATALLATEIWSEFLYLFLIAAACLATTSAETTQRQRFVRWMLAGLLIGLAAITRGFGIVAVIALILTVALRAPRYTLPVAALACLPLVAVQSLELGGGTDYLDVFRQWAPELNALPDYLWANLHAVLDGLHGLFATTPTSASGIALATLLPLAAVGLLARIARFHFDAIYTLGYCALLLLWPFPDVAWRLVYPLAPLLLIYATVGVALFSDKLRRQTAAALLALPCALAVLIAALGVQPIVARYFNHDLPAELQHWRVSRYWLTASESAPAIRDLEIKQAMIDLMRRAAKAVPADGCIYAHHPQATMLYARRAAWPTPPDGQRPIRPQCTHHLLLSDGDAHEAARGLWSDYTIVDTAPVPGGVAGVLVRYPQ